MYLNPKTKKCLEKSVGLSIDELINLDFKDEKKFIKNKTGKALSFSKKRDSRMMGRGNPLLARRRIATIEEIDKRIENKNR